MKILYGYDKHFKSIYNGSIVKFYDMDANRYKVGHLWYCDDWEDYGSFPWVVSFNHQYSETSQEFINVRNITVIGNIKDDEEILKNYWNGDEH